MQTASSTWSQIEASGSYDLNVRFVLGSTTYTNESIASGSLVLTHYLYEKYGVGNACAAQLKLMLYDADPIPDGIVQATLSIAITDGTSTSEYLPCGTFFLNTVQWFDDGETVQLTLYDALALSDVYLYENGAPASGNVLSETLVSQICTKLGITAPSDTTGYSGLSCPPVENATCREILCAIGAIKGGNWTVDKNNRLRFVSLADIDAVASNYSISVADLERTSETESVTAIKLAGIDKTYSVGTSGLSVEADCVYASSGTTASQALATIIGKTYTGYNATDALITLLYELGDIASIDGTNIQVPVDYVSLTYNQGCWGTVRAPLTDEIENRITQVGTSNSDRKLRRLSNIAGIQLTAREYLTNLLQRINEQANTAGGYTYITEGQGFKTYDYAVADPLVGAEATKVTDLRGGYIWIGEKDQSGNWVYKTLVSNGHIASEFITAINVTAGRIASANGSSYWDLDSGDMTFGGSFNLSIPGYTTGTQNVSMGSFDIVDTNGNSHTHYGLQIKSEDEQYANPVLHLFGRSWGANTLAEAYGSGISTSARLRIDAFEGRVAKSSKLWLDADNVRLVHWSTSTHSVDITLYDDSIYVHGCDFRIESGYRKSKVVDTENYGNRILQCLETPTPMFSDYGSAITDDSGSCIVSLDDIFAETVRTNCVYQVFLQACGAGGLWVESKHPGYFIVKGSPNLAFDWTITARQENMQFERLEDEGIDLVVSKERSDDGIVEIEEIQQGAEDYISELERLQYEAA